MESQNVHSWTAFSVAIVSCSTMFGRPLAVYCGQCISCPDPAGEETRRGTGTGVVDAHWIMRPQLQTTSVVHP